MDLIWTEKFRPQTFDEIKGQKEIIPKVEAFVKSKNMPHLLFTGPAGVGKTTTALVIVKQMYGDTWRENFLELNASDERGIDVVRVKVKNFARTKSLENVPFKIIYLDECDALTREAQQALRRTMENYTHTCRFILSANYSSKIIDPIQSRCAVFRFKPLMQDEVLDLINYIIKKESLTMDEDAKKALFEASHGDCRRVENILQSCSAINKVITKEAIYSMASLAKPEDTKKILELAINGEFVKSRDLLLKTMLNFGLSGIDMIRQLQQRVLDLEMDNQKKMELVAACGDTEFRLSEGADDYIQLEAFLAKAGTLNSK